MSWMSQLARASRGLVGRAWLTFAIVTLPTFAAAGLLGVTLLTVVRGAERDFEAALSTSAHIAHVRLALEREYGLVVRLPAELDLTRIEEGRRQIAAASQEVDVEIDHLSGEHIVSAATVSEMLAVHRQMGETSAKIVEASKSFAQSTALELAIGPFEEQRQTLSALLDAVASSVTEVANRARSDLRKSARVASVITPLALAGALISMGVGLWMFRRRFLTPVLQLTDHVAHVRDTGSVAVEESAGLSQRTDEIGQLATAFTELMRELDTAQRQLIAYSEAEVRKQVDLLKTALTHMSQGLSMFGADRRLIIANEQYAEVYGIPPHVIKPGMTLREIRQLRVAVGSYYGDPELYVESADAVTGGTGPAVSIFEHHNGRIICEVRRPRSGGGGWVTTHEDVTERKRVEDKIAHMARHDALTNLPNRVQLRDNLIQELKRGARGGRVAVLCLDLDRFKEVNDTFGHPIGDALLRSVTERLVGCVREGDTVSRLSGDEFAIVHPGIAGDLGAEALAQRIINAIEEPYEIDGHQLSIGVSVGIAIAPENGCEPDELLKNADLALYRAKTDGRGVLRFFEPEMDTRIRMRRQLQRDLRRAVVAGEFELLYQPIIQLDSEKITGFEALLRWNHPELGTIMPEDFIPVAEDTGLMPRLGEWVIRQACQRAATWPENIRVAVNLSAVQFRSPDLVATVQNALSQAGLRPNRLEIEITESVLLRNTEGTLATLHQLRELGVRISLDDFGTGYSSMSYLITFPFDNIKIDRSFIHDLPNRRDCIAVVRAVTSLAGSLNMTTTAEGVETEAELTQVRLGGCTEAQGFVFSPPVSEEAITTLIQSAREQSAA